MKQRDGNRGLAFGVRNKNTRHNGKGNGTHTLIDRNEGKKGGFTQQSIFEHELKHMAQHDNGTFPENPADREKDAIDAANEGRKNRGEKKRPYKHPRIKPEDIERRKKECECKNETK